MKKQVLIISLLLLLSASLLFASGRQSSQTSGGLTEITHIVWDRGSTPADQGTITDNWWTRYLNEQVIKFGAQITFIAIPRAQETQTIPIMVAAGNAPDITRAGLGLIKTFLAGDGMADMTTAIEKYGANIRALYGQDILEDVSYNGRYYYLPHFQNGIDQVATFIRRDWLDAIGMNVPTTIDEFYEVLKAIKEKDPGRRGASLIPFAYSAGGETSFLGFENGNITGFATTPITTEKLLIPWPMWPETKEGYRYLNKLQAEGLMSDMFVPDKGASLFRQSIARGDVFAFVGGGHYPYSSAYGDLYDKLREVEPNAVLESTTPFRLNRTSDWQDYRPYNPLYAYFFFVPATSKNLDLSVQILDFLSSDAGYLVGGLGIPGVDYTMVNNIPTPINRDSYLARVPWVETQFGLMAKPYSRVQDKELFLTNYIKDFNPLYWDQIRREVKFLSDIKYSVPTISAPTPVSDRLSGILAQAWDEAIVRVVFSNPANFDRLYDEAVREYKALGGDEVAAEAARLYAQQRR